MEQQLPQGTFLYLLIAALTSALIALLINKYFSQLFDYLFIKPLHSIYEWIYRWIAPRFFSISFRSYKKHLGRSNLSKIENPIGPSLDIPLENAFAPLKLISSIDQDNVDLFSHSLKNYRFIVLGGPGTGKTTLMKNLVISILKRGCNSELDNLIPVFVVLRKLASNKHTIEQAIVSSFKDHHFPGADKFVQSALSQGKMLIILDGLDEVGINRDFVTQQVREFCEYDEERPHKNHVIVTCREYSYRTEDLRDVIPNIVRVEPFTDNYMKIFLRGWPIHKGKSAIKLFGIIQEDPNIKDVCRNPLLLTILTGIFLDNDNFHLPTSRSQFYEACINELMVNRPARRNITQKYNPEIKKRILEIVCLERLETITVQDDPEEITQQAIYRCVKESIQVEIELNELIKELIEINGIIKPTTDDTFTCAHRTIQEYFAAREARRLREPEKVVKRFGTRDDLIEVIYFYCGLVDIIPLLNGILDILINQNRWVEAGKCLLNMQEFPNRENINLIISKLRELILIQLKIHPALEILSSLAQRTNLEFQSARIEFSNVIDQLAKEKATDGASALESVLSRTPEIAVKLIPGLLKHKELRWRKTAIILLRDIGSDDSIDQLIILLDSHDKKIRWEAAKALAALMNSHKNELIQKAEQLPQNINKTLWPLEKYFQGNLIQKILAAAPNEEETGNKGIDCALKGMFINKSKEKTNDELQFIKHWKRISIDVTIFKVKNYIIKKLKLWGDVLAMGGFSIVILLSLFYLLRNEIIFIRVFPVEIYSKNYKDISKIRSDIFQITYEIETLYPSKVSGIARILPQNWDSEPAIPDSCKDIYRTLRTAKSSFMFLTSKNFQVIKIRRLVGLIGENKIKNLNSDIDSLLPYPYRQRYADLLLGNFPVIYFGMILLTPWLFRAAQLSYIRRFNRRRKIRISLYDNAAQRFNGSYFERIFILNPFVSQNMFFFYCLFSLGESTNFKYSYLFILLSTLLCTLLDNFQWPKNPLFNAVKEFIPSKVTNIWVDKTDS